MGDGQVRSSSVKNQRATARFVPFSLTYAHFGKQFAGVVVDISENGLLLATDLSLISASIADIQIRLPGVPKNLVASGRTVWTDESTHRVGIELLDMSWPDRVRFRQWVREQARDLAISIEKSVSERKAREKVVALPARQQPPVNSVEAEDYDLAEESFAEEAEELAELRSALTDRDAPGATENKRMRARIAAVLALAAVTVLAVRQINVPRSANLHGWMQTREAPARSLTGSESPATNTGAEADAHDGTAGAAQNAEAEINPAIVWIAPQTNAAPVLLKLPTRPLIESGSLEIYCQRSMFIPRAGDAANRKQMLVVGRLISWTGFGLDGATFEAQGGTQIRLRATVGAQGEIVAVSPISGNAHMLPGILKVVREWRYEPTLLDGRPIDIQLDLTIEFHQPGEGNQRT